MKQSSIILFLIFELSISFAQKDIFKNDGLPIDSIGSNVFECVRYVVDNKEYKLDEIRRYSKSGLITECITFYDDHLHKVKFEYYNNNRIMSTTYIDCNNIDTSKIDSYIIEYYEYNQFNKISKSSSTNGDSLKYQYDDKNRVIRSINIIDGELYDLTYSYEKLYNDYTVIKVKPEGYRYILNRNNQLVMSFDNSSYMQCYYNENNQLRLRTITDISDFFENYSEVYGYDDSLNIIRKEEYSNNDITYTYTYSYNNDGLIDKVYRKRGNEQIQLFEKYEYSFY